MVHFGKLRIFIKKFFYFCYSLSIKNDNERKQCIFVRMCIIKHVDRMESNKTRFFNYKKLILIKKQIVISYRNLLLQTIMT